MAGSEKSGKRKASKGGHNPLKKRKCESKTVAKANVDEQLRSVASSLNSDVKIANAILQTKYDDLSDLILRTSINSELVEEVTKTVVTAQNGRQVYQLLSPSCSSSRIKSALRLLTACATSAPSGARCIIANLNFDRGPFTQTSCIRSLAVENDVRSAFVTLVLSLIVEQDWVQVRSVVEKRSPLLMVMNGLDSDRSSIIALALSSIKSALLENPAVSKKDKLRVFSAKNMSTILGLYHWKGHKLTWKVSTQFKKKKRSKKSPNVNEKASSVNPDELELVRKCVHEFLMLLFTSHKHGIVFKDDSFGTSGSNCNPVLLDLLKALPNPWEDEMIGALISRTLHCSPGIAGAFFSTLNGRLSPQATIEWRCCAEFAATLIGDIQLELPAVHEQQGRSARLAPHQLCQLAAACIYPQCVREVFCSAGLTHLDLAVRRGSLQLLVDVLDQVLAWRSRLLEMPAYGQEAADALTADAMTVLPSCRDVGQARLGLPVPSPTTQSSSGDSEAAESDRVSPSGEVLVLCARVVVACVQLSSSWLQDTAVVAGITSLLSEWKSDTGLINMVEEALAPLGFQHQIRQIPAVRQTLTLEDVDQILNDIVRGSYPSQSVSVTVDTSKLPGTSTPDVVEKEKFTLNEYTRECYTALKEHPLNLTVLKTWDDRLLSLSDCSSPLPDTWKQFVQELVKQALRSEAVGVVAIPQLTRLAHLIPCGHDTAATSVTAETAMQLVLGHSQFVDRFLELDPESSGCSAPLKEAIVRLLLTLVTTCPHLCKSSHVALYLSAYEASVSQSDQLLLQLIFKYEKSGISLNNFVPMVWGSAALNFYSPTQGGGYSLKSRPSPSNVIELLDARRLALTCRRLPLQLSLTPDPTQLLARSGNDAEDQDVYDVRFLLAVLTQLTGSEQPCDVIALLERGALSLLVCLLSCAAASVRLAAWTVMSRVHWQLQASRRRRFRLVWLTVLDVLRGSLSSRADSQDGGKDLARSGGARLPFVVAYSWARLLQVLSDPSHRLFRLVSHHLLRCASTGRLDTQRVPLFYELFNSRSRLEHRWQRDWLLDGLVHGVRQIGDFRALQRTVAYKLLLALAGCGTLAPARHRLLALLEATARVPQALWRLEYRHGLTAWLCGHVTLLSGNAASRAALYSLATCMVNTLCDQMHARKSDSGLSVLSDGLETFIVRFGNVLSKDSPLKPKLQGLLGRLKVVPPVS